MARPTPGPFCITRSGHTTLVSNLANDVAAFFDEGCASVTISREEALANASRFMAAEDMLAALLWLKPYAELQVKKYPDGEDIGGWRMVLAAIERATGSGA